MIYRKIPLLESHSEATLTCYISEDDPVLKMPPRPAMIVCPGGGYEFLSPREAEPIAKAYFAAGMNVFVLSYTVGANAKLGFLPLTELSLAICLIREHCAEFCVDPARVFVTGFSAGGHLAGSAAVLWNHPAVQEAIGVFPGGRAVGCNKPTAVVLAYPVITSGTWAHPCSFDNLCGADATPEERAVFSLERHVGADTAPVFLWHTLTDACVPVENALLFLTALQAAKIPFEAHLFPHGRHGLALATKETWSKKPERYEPHVQCWMPLALRWLNDCFGTLPSLG